MSGPKTSQYTLTSQQSRILREQQEREFKIKTEKLNINRYMLELRLLYVEIEKSIDEARGLNNLINSGTDYIEAINKVVLQSHNIIENQIKITENITINELEEKKKLIMSNLKEVKQKVNYFNVEFSNIKNMLKKKLEQDVDKSFSVSFRNFENTSSKLKVNKNLEKILNRLDILLNNKILVNFHDEINNIKIRAQSINSVEFFDNFNAIVVIPLENRCNKYLKEYEQNIDKFNDLVVHYKVMCEEFSVPFIPQIFSLDSIKNLELITTKMKIEFDKHNEETYITDSINLVMEEMGYTIFGSKDVVKRSGKHFHSELFYFDEGTAVNVTYSSDGKITMEIGGISNEDRLPNNLEINKLCDEMELFCNDFSKIEKKLLQKGIVIKNRISILPPDAQYAQIVNVSDYNLLNEFDHINIRHEKTQKIQKISKEI